MAGRLIDSAGVTVFEGTAVGIGASLPGAVTITLSAAQVAAAWSVFDTEAAVELTQIPAGAIVLQSLEEAVGTFDQNVSVNGFNAYTSGAAPTDAINLGDGPYAPPTQWTAAAFSYSAPAAQMNMMRANPGSSLYMQFGGNAPPTTGSYTFTLLLFYAP